MTRPRELVQANENRSLVGTGGSVAGSGLVAHHRPELDQFARDAVAAYCPDRTPG